MDSLLLFKNYRTLFFKKIFHKEQWRIKKNFERDQIYNNLKTSSIKEKISFLTQKILNFLPQNKKILIYSTYMSNLNEIKLNLLLNKSLLYYKSLRPYFLFEKKIISIRKKKFKALDYHKGGLEEFLSEELLKCIPSGYLENYENIGNIVNQILFLSFHKKYLQL